MLFLLRIDVFKSRITIQPDILLYFRELLFIYAIDQLQVVGTGKGPFASLKSTIFLERSLLSPGISCSSSALASFMLT